MPLTRSAFPAPALTLVLIFIEIFSLTSSKNIHGFNVLLLSQNAKENHEVRSKLLKL